MNSIVEKPTPKISSTSNSHWLIDGMLPVGHKGMIASCEGGCKTTLLAWIAIRVAVGLPVFDMEAKKGTVLMIDEETTISSLENKLNRFALSMGIETLDKVPNLHVNSMLGFRFGRSNTELLKVVADMKPALITIDSLLACLPSGRQGMGENSAETGIEVRDGLNAMLKASPGCSVIMTAHSGKPVMNFGINEYLKADMQALVRGHGSLVGEACDSGYGLKKISEYPLRFLIFPKARRASLPMKDVYVEMKEEKKGEGKASLMKIEPVPLPPFKQAIDLISLFLSEKSQLTAEEIRRKVANLYPAQEIKAGLNQLLENGIIRTTNNKFTFELSPASSPKSKEYSEMLYKAL